MTAEPKSVQRVWLESLMQEEALALFPSSVEVVLADQSGTHWASDASAQVILAAGLRYSGDVMDAFPRLRLIARIGIGVDNVVLADATARGIVVTNTPDGPTESTAEHAVALLLGLAKRLKQGNANLAEGRWGPRNDPLVGTEVRGKTVGLVGLGRIGRRVAEICRLGLHMRVVGYDPLVDSVTAASLGVESLSLEDVIRQADFLSLHAPATPETAHLMNRARIAWMKPGSTLVNVARGPLVDEVALLEALNSGHLSGAGIDVFENEPPSLDSALRNHPSVIATPHIASLTVEGRDRMEFMAVERVLAFLRGERPDNVVNPEVYDDRP